MAASVQAKKFFLRSSVLLLSACMAVTTGGSDRLQAQAQQQVPLQREPDPLYPPTAPPPRRIPLPDVRQQLEEEAVGADYRVSALQADNQGSLWVGSWQGLAKINAATGQILTRVSLPNTSIGAMVQDRNGRIWVGTYEGIARVDPKTGTITAQNFALPSNRVLSMLIDQRGFLWVGTDAGLAMISPDQGLLMTTIKNLPGVSANALALDAVGDLWVGTLDGLVQVDTASAFIKRRVNNLPGTTVQALASSPFGNLWIGTPTNLLEANVGIQRRIVEEPVVTANAARPTPRKATQAKRQQSARSNTPQAVLTRPVPTRRRVVFAVNNPSQFTLRTVTQLQGQNVTSLEFDRANSIWVGTTTGLLRVNPFNGATGGVIPNLPSSRVLSLSPDTGGKLWVGTSEGLAWVNTTTFQGYPHQTFRPVSR